MVEIRTLGSKDFIGVPIVLGTGRSPHRCVVQIAGKALRITANDLLNAIERWPELRRLLLAYVQAALVHSAQLVACNTRHSLSQRLARWLLIANDELQSSEIVLTHDSLSRALGVRRAGVTTAIGDMEDAGLIRRGRGRIEIINRGGLEEACCGCYRTIRSEHERTNGVGCM
jgi:CRP-like cAMP-binding protein